MFLNTVYAYLAEGLDPDQLDEFDTLLGQHPGDDRLMAALGGESG